MPKLNELRSEIAALEAKANVLETQAEPDTEAPPAEDVWSRYYMIDWNDPSWRSIADDDPELAPYLAEPKLPANDAELRKLFASYAFTSRKKTLSEAKRIVAKQRKHRAIYATVVDESKPRDERLAAIQRVLDEVLEPGWHFLKQFTVERLLERILPANAPRVGSFGKECVRRPPEDLCDVWSV